MTLQRNTVILVAAAIALGGVVLITETLQSTSNGDGVIQKSGDRLFTFQEDQIKILQIERPGETLKFERDQEDVWQMTAPESAIAEQASIAFLLSLLTTEPISRTLTITPDQKADFGFTDPIGTIEMTLDTDETHTLVLGGKDFSGGSIYVQVDPASDPAESAEAEIEIQVAAIDLINGVERPLEEWKAVIDAPEDTAESSPASNSAPSANADITPPETPETTEGVQPQPPKAASENSANPSPEMKPKDTPSSDNP
ncbi:MAG: hypothetical protein QNJ46_23140 [Leptolyngbyaceae cyanobacterium MO_188.B28]|nr:hypothetical protein [Leptolyngbyaceae cyanobacterium MO_188.B28]